MKYYLYDFDGTIYEGDSGVDIVLFACKKYPRFKCYIPKILLALIKYKLRIWTIEETKDVIFSFLAKIKDVDAFVAEFWETHEHKIKDFWKNKKNHSKDIIISASAYFWLKPIADKYKVKDLFATDINVKTGKVMNSNCHGKEKVRVFKEKYPEAIIEEMYTDSINDLPLIEIAKKGILVKKNKLYNYYEYKPNIMVRFWRFGWGVYHKNEEIWNYLIIGGLTTIVSLATYYICVLTFLNPKIAWQLQLANVISWVFAVLFAYVTNKIFVFKSKTDNILKEMSKFVSSRVLTLLIDMAIMFVFVTICKFNDKIMKLVVQVVVTVLNYVFSKLLVFKKDKSIKKL